MPGIPKIGPTHASYRTTQIESQFGVDLYAKFLCRWPRTNRHWATDRVPEICRMTALAASVRHRRAHQQTTAQVKSTVCGYFARRVQPSVTPRKRANMQERRRAQFLSGRQLTCRTHQLSRRLDGTFRMTLAFLTHPAADYAKPDHCSA
jgi:hypothetical protein